MTSNRLTKRDQSSSRIPVGLGGRVAVSACALALIPVALSFIPGCGGSALHNAEPKSALERPAQPPPAPADRIAFDDSLPTRATIHEILLKAGLTPTVVHELIERVRPVYNLARLRAGNRLLVRLADSRILSRLEYDIDDEEYLVVRREHDSYQAELRKRTFKTVPARIQGRIETSLWDSVLSAGESQQLAMALHNVFQWDIDFTSVQPGDSFTVIVDKKFRQGKFVKYGEIRAARYATASGNDFEAFRFYNPDTGRDVHYDADGQAVRKAFLKVPFHFNPRISSGYSTSRLHPILKTRRPHLGVDYGAPYGTSVLASASGRVVFAGTNGGFGKQVRIRHGNGYTTGYGHLSRITVKAGEAVSQGERIGKVGATGLATGAHLDYRVQDRQGRYINPRKMVSWPSDKPVRDDLRQRFQAVRDAYLLQLRGGARLACDAEGTLAEASQGPVRTD